MLRVAFCVLAAAAMVAATPAQTQVGNQPLTFDCLIEPHLRLKLATPIAGVLKEVMVDRGAIVRKGQLIAQLESAGEEANVQLAAARAENDATIKGKRARVEFL